MERFDALMVDEGEGFFDSCWVLLQQRLAVPDGGVRYVFLDPQQRPYDRQITFGDGSPANPLTADLRNTRAIHADAQPCYSGEALRPQGPEGRTPEVVAIATGEERNAAIGYLLRHLTAPDGVKPRDSTVRTSRRPGRFGRAAWSPSVRRRP
jgi:hypothetical protein